MLARFISADSVVPGDASGGMDGVALKGLTVDFHEPGFVAQVASENGQPFWFQMSGKERQRAGSPWGPSNPQALNRYSYVLNNPVKATDPMGHWTFQVSLGFSAFVFLGIRGEASIAFDGEGNTSLLLSGGGGAFAGAGVSAGPSATWTNAPTVNDLTGESVQVGFQGGEVLGVSVEKVIFPTDTEKYSGWSVGGGAKLLALPIEIHGTVEGAVAPFTLHSEAMRKFWKSQFPPPRPRSQSEPAPSHYVCTRTDGQGNSYGGTC